MTDYAWPDGMDCATMEWGRETSNIVHRSSLTGSSQVAGLPTCRWVVSVNMPPQLRSTAGAVEAFFNSLIGGVDRVLVHRFDRPQPRGTLRGSPTLSAGVAQFSDTLVLAGAFDTSRRNLLPRSKEFDDAAWTKVNGSVTANAAAAPTGATEADLFTENTAAAATHRIWQSCAFVATATNTFSVYVKANGRTKCRIYAFDGPATSSINGSFDLVALTATPSASGVGASATAAGITDVGGGWFRCWVTGVAGVSGGTPNVQLRLIGASGSESYTGDGVSGAYFWGAQVEATSTPTDYITTTSAASYAAGTIKAGDMLGVGSQLFQVRADAIASSAGAMTVYTVNRTRSSLTSGAAVVWDRPTATFAVQDQSSAFSFGPAAMGPSSFRLVEAY